MIGLRSYGQRDPLVEYKKESFELFENLLSKIRQDTLVLLLNLRIAEDIVETNLGKKTTENKKKIGRNEPCFCGSNKKYKHCCGSLSKV